MKKLFLILLTIIFASNISAQKEEKFKEVFEAIKQFDAVKFEEALKACEPLCQNDMKPLAIAILQKSQLLQLEDMANYFSDISNSSNKKTNKDMVILMSCALSGGIGFTLGFTEFLEYKKPNTTFLNSLNKKIAAGLISALTSAYFLYGFYYSYKLDQKIALEKKMNLENRKKEQERKFSSLENMLVIINKYRENLAK